MSQGPDDTCGKLDFEDIAVHLLQEQKSLAIGRPVGTLAKMRETFDVEREGWNA
jgi:hypothetical protein